MAKINLKKLQQIGVKQETVVGVVDKSNEGDTIKKENPEEQERTTRMKAKFLDMLQQDRVAGNITVAANAVGISRKQVYVWRDADADFNTQVLDIIEKAYDIRAEMAEDKLEEAVRKGNITAIIFTLKNLKPSKYNKDVNDMGGTVNHVHKVSPRFAKVLERLLPEDDK